MGKCEIDPQMMKIYRKNHNPKYPFLWTSETLTNGNLPDELFVLDILMVPALQRVSIAGIGKGLGKRKAFREGQAKQSLDDLFFITLMLLKGCGQNLCGRECQRNGQWNAKVM
ncbi:hypothetical protein PO124_23360 [Bacillus licheniformis]|nr:hypothetical protein [Bacillus licheniformis]